MVLLQRKKYLNDRNHYLIIMSSTVYTTRSGRQIKKPVKYEPDEKCLDDYTDDDDDVSDGEDIHTESEYSSEDEDEDADDSGNLKGFVVSDEDDDEDDEA